MIKTIAATLYVVTGLIAQPDTTDPGQIGAYRPVKHWCFRHHEAAHEFRQLAQILGEFDHYTLGRDSTDPNERICRRPSAPLAKLYPYPPQGKYPPPHRVPGLLARYPNTR